MADGQHLDLVSQERDPTRCGPRSRLILVIRQIVVGDFRCCVFSRTHYRNLRASGLCIATRWDDRRSRRPSCSTLLKLAGVPDLTSRFSCSVVSAPTPMRNGSVYAPNVGKEQVRVWTHRQDNRAHCAKRLSAVGRQAGRSSMGAGRLALPGWTCPPPPTCYRRAGSSTTSA